MSKPQTAASPPPTDKATGFLAFANVTYQTLWPLVAQTKEAVGLLHAFANVRYWRKADVTQCQSCTALPGVAVAE